MALPLAQLHKPPLLHLRFLFRQRYLQAGDASAALTAALENQEWIGVAEDSAADAGALFSLSRTLWVSTEKALLKFEGENATAALLRILREARVAADDVKALLHEVSPVDSSEPQKMDIETIDSDRLFDTGRCRVSA